jgi:DNA mismatch repair protein MutS
MSAKKETPLTKQYNEIKSKYPESILLFRLGDFYETFGEDAITAAKVCGITLTKRNNGAAGKTELAGFPHHQLDNYLPKLVKAGYRVAVCEQLEDPKKAKGIVKRGVTEIVTPGVALYEKMLDSGKNNFVLCIKIINYQKNNIPDVVGAAWCDISTGELVVDELPKSEISDTIAAVSPSEILLAKEDYPVLERLLDQHRENGLAITKLDDWLFDSTFGLDIFKEKFPANDTKGYGFERDSPIINALGALLNYIKQLQGELPKHLTDIKRRSSGDFMNLDLATRKNLEITFSNLSGGKEGSLFQELDMTKTAMGSRMLKSWISMPLLEYNAIIQRHDKVESLYRDEKLMVRLESLLDGVCDIERLLSKISRGKFIPRDFSSIRDCLSVLPKIREELIDEDIWRIWVESLLGFEDLNSLLKTAIAEDPPTSLGSGNAIAYGYNEELDGLRELKRNAKQWLDRYRDELREKTGVSTIKIGQNNVFGYYIEISRVHSDKLDLEALGLTRKQTLANAERYISPKLQEFEEKIHGAEENISTLEIEILSQVAVRIVEYIRELHKLAACLAELDTVLSFAGIARKNGYIRPKIIENTTGHIAISGGRHPIVEKLLPAGTGFVSNDLNLSDDEKKLIVLTGPNMSGKSIYLKQNGLIVIMAQAGCFVPATECEMSIVDRVFTRVGAHDNLQTGQSTFLVEMQEAATIMNTATEKSLLLLDEIGRGTATYDGISIAWAIAEHILEKLGSNAIFATHYHELAELEKQYDKAVNMRVEVNDNQGRILFTHRVVPGHSDHSFGVHVAEMAGLPYSIIDRSKEIMEGLETKSEGDSITAVSAVKPKVKKDDPDQLAIFTFQDDELRDKLKAMNIENITPIEAFKRLAELISEAKRK